MCSSKQQADYLNENRDDYERWMIEYGFSAELLRALVENESDQIPMPPEFDGVVLLDSPIQGKGLFATRPIAAGELIAPARISRKRTPAGRFTNHSISPNARFVRTGDAPDADLNMVARRSISPGEEVLMDYRQAGSANGNGIWPDKTEAMETVRLRLRKRGQMASMPPAGLDQCMAGVLIALRYIPTEFVNLVISGRVSKVAAEIGFFRAGLYLSNTLWICQGRGNASEIKHSRFNRGSTEAGNI